MYNLNDTVGNVDIVDFPGVNDVDKSVFDVGNLILTLAQVIIFVVDYRYNIIMFRHMNVIL